MKHTILYIAAIALLTACQQEELPQEEQALGYLSIPAVEVKASDIEIISTRVGEISIDDLTLSIEETEQSFQPIPPEIALAPGEYHITISNNATPTEAAVFEMDTVITIEEEKVTNLEVEVPMTNFGVQLKLPDEFDDESIIKEYTFTVNNQTLLNGETAYFAYSEAANISYSLSAKNEDDETLTTEEQTYEGTVAQGTIYVITYNWETQTLEVE